VSEGLLLTPALVTMAGPVPRRGPSTGRLEVIPDAALAWRGGLVTYAGPADAIPGDAELWPEARHAGGAIVPGFVDCHTHLPFFGWRSDEFESKLAGRSYRDLQGSGGGIARSARLLASASDEEVMEFCGSLAREMMAHGTTAMELKTGYGLSLEAELRQARLARRLGDAIPQTTTVTLLACHAVPPGRDRADWVDQVCAELIPAAAAEGLVDAVDVYVEDIAFTVDDFLRVAAVAVEHGLAVRCHADQLGASGAAEAAVRAGARNADHLNHLSAEGVAALGQGGTAAVVLPVADLFTGEMLPATDLLLEAGAALVLATDFNPGTSPCLSLPETISVAASLYRLSPNVALAAATINPAWALGLDGGLGSLEAGKRADFVLLDTDDPSMIAYRPGHNPVAGTWVGGMRVHPSTDPG
jgi:imidazolonepropionase